MKKLLFFAFVAGMGLAACNSGADKDDANKIKQDSVSAVKRADSLMQAAKVQRQKDSVSDAMKKDSAKDKEEKEK